MSSFSRIVCLVFYFSIVIAGFHVLSRDHMLGRSDYILWSRQFCMRLPLVVQVFFFVSNGKMTLCWQYAELLNHLIIYRFDIMLLLRIC